MYFVWHKFNAGNMKAVSIFFSQLDFNGRKINVISVYFLVQFRWKTDVTARILM